MFLTLFNFKIPIMFLKKRLINLNILFFVSLLLFSCGSDDDVTPTPDPILGCTDPEASNYNPNATEDNGSCEYDPIFSGDLLWIKTFGGSNEEDAISIVESNDGGYMVLGYTKSTDGDVTGKTTTDLDYWLLKLDENGNKIWDKTYGGSADDQATSISKTSDGGYIISGFTASNDGDVTENAGFHDYWIVKVTSTGAIQWQKSFGFAGQDQAFKVIQTQDGGYFATGFLDVGLADGGGNDIIDNQNNKASLHSLGDYWGIKMDADGNKIWRRYFGGSHVDQGKDVLQTEDGGFLLIGISESSDYDISNARGANDYWVVKTNADGDLMWEKSFGGSETDRAFSVTKTTDNNFIITGETRSSDFDISNPIGGGDIWAVKFNATNGAIIWEKSFGGTQFETSRGIIALENGNYAIAGSARSTDGDVSGNNGANDAWILIINNDGTLLLEKNIGGSAIDFANYLTETNNQELVFVGSSTSNDIDIPNNQGNKDILIFKMN